MTVGAIALEGLEAQIRGCLGDTSSTDSMANSIFSPPFGGICCMFTHSSLINFFMRGYC